MPIENGLENAFSAAFDHIAVWMMSESVMSSRMALQSEHMSQKAEKVSGFESMMTKRTMGQKEETHGRELFCQSPS